MKAATPTDARASASRSFRHVACCVDGDPGDAVAIATARGLAGDDGRLRVVHVAGPTQPDGADPPHAARVVQAATRDAPGAEPVVLHGVPGHEICRWAREEGADLVVVASRHPGRWGMSVLGPVTRHVVDHAPCPVLVVRQREA
jgi:nucleotide-binding universal stress UspA family protein